MVELVPSDFRRIRATRVVTLPYPKIRDGILDDASTAG